MSDDDDDSRRVSVIGKRPNDSPGHGKKIPKGKAADEVPAGTGRHLSLEAKAIIFEIFEKFKRFVTLVQLVSQSVGPTTPSAF